MKIKSYMKPYKCRELIQNLKRDERRLKDMEKEYHEVLRDGRETLCNGAYDCYGSDYDLWEDNMWERYVPKIRDLEGRIEYWKSRLKKRQFTHGKGKKAS